MTPVRRRSMKASFSPGRVMHCAMRVFRSGSLTRLAASSTMSTYCRHSDSQSKHSATSRRASSWARQHESALEVAEPRSIAEDCPRPPDGRAVPPKAEFTT